MSNPFNAWMINSVGGPIFACLGYHANRVDVLRSVDQLDRIVMPNLDNALTIPHLAPAINVDGASSADEYRQPKVKILQSES